VVSAHKGLKTRCLPLPPPAVRRLKFPLIFPSPRALCEPQTSCLFRMLRDLLYISRYIGSILTFYDNRRNRAFSPMERMILVQSVSYYLFSSSFFPFLRSDVAGGCMYADKLRTPFLRVLRISSYPTGARACMSSAWPAVPRTRAHLRTQSVQCAPQHNSIVHAASDAGSPGFESFRPESISCDPGAYICAAATATAVAVSCGHPAGETPGAGRMDSG